MTTVIQIRPCDRASDTDRVGQSGCTIPTGRDIVEEDEQVKK